MTVRLTLPQGEANVHAGLRRAGTGCGGRMGDAPGSTAGRVGSLGINKTRR